MAYSYNEVTGTGSAQLLAVPEYIDQAHIFVSVNGVDTLSYTWVNPNQISVTGPNGSKVRAYRKTSPMERVVDYMDGMSLSEAVLDADSKQAFYLAQEQLDATNEAVAAVGTLPDALAQIANETGTSSTNAATASTKAAEAAASAAAALANKNATDTNAATASTKATEAAASAAAALANKNATDTNAATASTKATEAAASASSASTSAGTASTKAVEAAASVDSTKDVPSGTITGGVLRLANRGQCIPITAGVTVPAGVFALGQTVSLYNDTAGSLTITQGSGLTLRNSGLSTTGNRTLAQRAICTIWFRSATEAVITGCS